MDSQGTRLRDGSSMGSGGLGVSLPPVNLTYANLHLPTLLEEQHAVYPDVSDSHVGEAASTLPHFPPRGPREGSGETRRGLESENFMSDGGERPAGHFGISVNVGRWCRRLSPPGWSPRASALDGPGDPGFAWASAAAAGTAPAGWRRARTSAAG